MDETPTIEGGGTPPPAPTGTGRRSRRRVVAIVAVVTLVTGGVAVASWRSGASTGSASSSAAGERPRSTTPAITAPGPSDPGSAGALADAGASDAAGEASARGSAPDVPGARPAPAGGAAAAGSAGSPGSAGSVLLDSVPVGESVRVGAAVEARVDSITSARVRPRGPGDIAGPAAVVVLRLVNTSAEPVDLTGLAVTATGADGAPAIPSDGTPSDVLTGSLPAGAERAGTYVFGLRGGGEGATSTSGVRLEVGLSSAPEVAVVVAR